MLVGKYKTELGIAAKSVFDTKKVKYVQIMSKKEKKQKYKYLKRGVFVYINRGQ